MDADGLKASYEFRILEDLAAKHLGDGIGKKSWLVRVVEVTPNDPLFAKIGSLKKKLKDNKLPFITSWIIRRSYTADEISNANLLHVKTQSIFEPEGEQCGTVYDYSDACPYCGVGRKLVSSLKLDPKAVPKGRDLAKTIADEWIISARLAKAMKSNEIRGFELAPVETIRGRSDDWFQLRVTSKPVELVPPTKCGNDPSDDDPLGTQKCPLGHVLGLNVLSELYVDKNSWDGSDIAWTRQAVGIRMGVLVPSPLLLISPKLGKLFKEVEVKRIVEEVVHLV